MTIVRSRVLGSSLLMLLALAAFGALIFYLHYRPLPPEMRSFETATLQAGDTAATVTLPHDWIGQGIDTSSARYILPLSLESMPAAPWSIYLPSVDSNAMVWLNGERIGDGGRIEPPMARNHNRPLLFELPVRLLAPGANELWVDVYSEPPGRGLLGAVHAGPMASLLPHYRLRYALKITSMQVVTIATLAISLVMLMLWWLRREEPMYLWFSITAGFWLIYILNYYVANVPFDARIWVVLVRFGALGWFVLSILIFINRFLGIAQPRYEAALMVVFTAVPLYMLTLDHAAMLEFGLHVFSPAIWLLGLDPAIKMTRAVWGRRDQEIIWLTFSGLAILMLGTHDVLMNNGLISRDQGYFIQYAPPLTVVVFAWMLVRRFVRTLRAAEILNRELEQRVAQKVAEARVAYDRLSEVEREQALNRERERIMRDMHDGVGGHLVSTLYMMQRGHSSPVEVREALNVALQDLRLMIDSMESVEGDLVSVLANLRSRLEPLLDKAGIRSVWRFGEIPPLKDFGPEASLQVMRIVQEAVTNIIKHARATEMHLVAEPRDGAVVIEIADNGIGLPDAAPVRSHRGLANMRQRALKINANILIVNNNPGTLISLKLGRA